MATRVATSVARTLRANLLAMALLLAGCVPTRWPERPPGPPAPVPPVASTPRPQAPPPVQAPPAGPSAALPAPLPRSKSGNPPFYEVLGTRYFVLDESSGYSEQGVASWYGAPFHGKRTSSGDVYDMHGFTAAHKTLPLPSLVKVTNLDTGRSVVVTVNDRGPFVKNRLIDVSYAAAKELDIIKTGTGRVRVEAVPTSGTVAATTPASAAVAAEPAVPLAQPRAQRIFMQVGAFSDEANAARFKSSLESNGVNKVVIRYDDEVSPALYRVRIGPIEGSAEYDALASRMASLSIANPRLVTESPDTGATSSKP